MKSKVVSDYDSTMPIKVFIFEDHWMCREALVSVISGEKDIEVVGETDNARSGVAMVKQQMPDVVLMDLRLKEDEHAKISEPHGIEATRRIIESLPETRVIIYTDSLSDDDLRSSIDAGASGYLMKSEVHEPAVILTAIRSVHLGESYMTPAITKKLLTAIRSRPTYLKHSLTKRELEVLQLIARGANNQDISERLGIHSRTVANHVSSLLAKLEARNRTEAVALAREHGVLQ